MKRLLLACLAGGALAAAQTSCSSSDDAKPRVCSSEVTPPSFEPSTPTVSFSRDVIPIITRTCVDPLCHGDATGTTSIYLNGGAAATHAALVGKPSSKLPSMSYVKSGDPAESFLMRKLDATQCALDAQCTGGTCGDSMPNEQDQLPSGERDTIRRWIAQGAKND
ncbi:MAG: hypothetical protein KIT84_10860 [Labilithrix sp.]|nr:hypothetical protein [Labilithrix sp.]MCW5811507.1 hypothetical protein [Labilithrix sp.]